MKKLVRLIILVAAIALMSGCAGYPVAVSTAPYCNPNYQYCGAYGYNTYGYRPFGYRGYREYRDYRGWHGNGWGGNGWSGNGWGGHRGRR